MADRVVIVRTGAHLVSLSFDHIDEILGADRIESVENIPEGVVLEGLPEESPDGNDGYKDQQWILSRGSWLPVGTLLPGVGVSDSSQVVVVTLKNVRRAFAVDRVLGIETAGKMAVFPERAQLYTDVPIAGVRFWKDEPVLELDLSRLILLDSRN